MELYFHHLFILLLFWFHCFEFSSADEELRPLEYPENISVEKDPTLLQGFFKGLGLSFFNANLKEIENSILFRIWSLIFSFSSSEYELACDHKKDGVALMITNEGHMQCQKKCSDENTKYSQFLTKKIEYLTRKAETGYKIQFRPDTEHDLHKCVKRRFFDEFSCECVHKYKIYVNQPFQIMFNDVILGKNVRPDGSDSLLYPNYNFLSKTVGFIIISHLSPKTAFYYLVWWAIWSHRR